MENQGPKTSASEALPSLPTGVVPTGYGLLGLVTERQLRLLTLASLVMGLTGFPTQTYAQAGWLITPGRGWGPYYLGMTEDAALQVRGPRFNTNSPVSDNGFLVWASWDSLRTTLRFAQQSDSRYTLHDIVVTDTTSSTREGIRIGSPMGDVVRAYGDQADNVVTGPGTLRVCLNTLLSADRDPSAPSGQPDYRRLHLRLDYVNKGIEFSFWPMVDSGPGMPSVRTIQISAPRDCRTV